MKRWQQSTQDELKKYVPDLEGEIERLQEQLKEANEIIISFDKLVGKLTGTVFQNVLDYYKKYNVDRYKKIGGVK